jgi:hypothetical protein
VEFDRLDVEVYSLGEEFYLVLAVDQIAEPGIPVEGRLPSLL